MVKSKFIWECLGEKYYFDPNLNYLIYFRGCYCPPSAGHYSVVKEFDHLENVKIMIHQIGDKSRHGVPYRLNRKIWKIYIDELLDKDKIYLVKCESSMEILDYIKDIDTVVYVRGNEGQNIEKTEKENNRKFKRLKRKLKENFINLDFYYMDRPNANIMSATKFVESVILYKYHKHKYRKLKKFMPKHLSYSSIQWIVDHLEKCNLK